MFEDQAKINAFDLIAGKFYNHNFGQTTKADFEVLMFKIYVDNCNKTKASTSDFELATALGITEQKVRNLKVKMELQYPDNNKQAWKENFIRSVQYAMYDDKNGLVKIAIHDPNVKRNLENWIDNLHIYSEAQLNAKLLQMRPDHFIKLVQTIAEELGDQQISQKELVKQLEHSSVSKFVEEKGIIERIKNGEPVQDLIPDILKCTKKAGMKAILKAIPLSESLKTFIDTFAENL